MGEKGVFHFSWDQPGMGSLKCHGKHSAGRYTVFRHIENLNEGAVYFHLMDAKYPPVLQIVAARAIPYQLASMESSQRITAAQMENQGFAVTEAFVSYAAGLTGEETMHGDHNSSFPAGAKRSDNEKSSVGKNSKPSAECRGAPAGREQPMVQRVREWGDGERVELKVVSPRAFFCSIQSSQYVIGPRSIASHCYLYLEYRISCEKFRNVWGPDEQLWLHAGVVGGLDKPEIAMAGTLLPIRNIVPLSLIEGPLKEEEPEQTDSGVTGQDGEAKRPVRREVQLTDDDSDTDDVWAGLGETSTKKEKEEAARDQLMDLVMEAFKWLCTGVQPVVTKIMTHKFGRDWLQQSTLPPGHTWRDRLDLHIDLEGLLHVMTVYWNESFEATIGDSQLLHALQEVAIYWANQELSKFDELFVYKFLQHAYDLLMHLNATEAAAGIESLLKSLEDGDVLLDCMYATEAESPVSTSVDLGLPPPCNQSGAAIATNPITTPHGPGNIVHRQAAKSNPPSWEPLSEHESETGRSSQEKSSEKPITEDDGRTATESVDETAAIAREARRRERRIDHCKSREGRREKTRTRGASEAPGNGDGCVNSASTGRRRIASPQGVEEVGASATKTVEPLSSSFRPPRKSAVGEEGRSRSSVHRATSSSARHQDQRRAVGVRSRSAEMPAVEAASGSRGAAVGDYSHAKTDLLSVLDDNELQRLSRRNSRFGSRPEKTQ
eukprot:GHVQ01004698.1.p1 GENE.GHVQ01004698.1~~GHVQ01004698.1.p1  ORF type:complete len:720 (+),score=114.15 GHVQ01004698.1:340-2499(+)